MEGISMEGTGAEYKGAGIGMDAGIGMGAGVTGAGNGLDGGACGVDFAAIPPRMLEPLPEEERQRDRINRPSVSYWRNAWLKLSKDPLAMAGFCVIAIMVLLAVLGPWLSPYTYKQQNYAAVNEGPSALHWFGTDKFGRDLFTRVAYGARISLTIGVCAAAINMVIGVLFGGAAGYLGGTADIALMRVADIVEGVPSLLYIILVMIFLGASMRSVIVALCISYWIRTSRVVRGQILQNKGLDYTLAARAVGESGFQILTRHLIPNSMGPVIVTVSFLIPQAIFYEAFLSFIGIGISLPVASWGTLANDAQANLGLYPHLAVFPAAAIAVTIFALNFIGDGLRDALDPRLK
jgi:oligopeptide transport system permease protein